MGFFARVEHAHMSLLLSTSTDSLVATGICKLASLPYEITTGASELTLKPAAGEEIQGSAVIDYLLTIASVVQGSEGSEQKQVTEWVDKDCSLEALDQHLALRVFIADGLAPTMADVKQFARLRESVSKQKPNQRNESPNVTLWFNLILNACLSSWSTLLLRRKRSLLRGARKRKRKRMRINNAVKLL